ncbi:MAG: hypothetical protein AABZ39_20210 [Spirochaetota bacterium]
MKRVLLAFLFPILFAAVASGAKPSASVLTKASNDMMTGFKLYEEKRDYAAARKHLEAAYDAGLRNGTLVFRLGYCKEKASGDKTSAKELYKESLALFKANPADAENYKKAYYNYGVLYYELVNKTPDVEDKIKLLMTAKRIWDEALAVHSNNEYVLDYYPKLETDLKRLEKNRHSR